MIMNTLEGIKDAGFVQIEPDTLHRIVILTKEQRDWTTSEIERLRKEKEWLIETIGRWKNNHGGWFKTIAIWRGEILEEMQKALKEDK